MKNLDLSIIILNWNTSDLLVQCLNSVFKFTKKINFEVIVCDNGSTDGSEKIIKRKFGKKIRFIQNGKNLGFSAGNNPGLKMAKGRYLLLLNSDTKIDYDVFSNLVKWMDKRPQVGVCGPRRLNADGSIQTNGVGNLPSLQAVFFNLVLPFHKIPIFNAFLPALHFGNRIKYLMSHMSGWVTGACFMIRREVYEKIGGLDENIFMYVEETEYCKRVKDQGWQIWYVADDYIYHLERGSSTSGKTNAIVGVYKGLKYYFLKHKPAWQVKYLVWFLKLGAFLRMPLNMKTYLSAWKAV